MLCVVGVESCVYQFASAEGVVVGYCAEGDVAFNADGVACEYCVSEGTVFGCGVDPVVYPRCPGLSPVFPAPAALT